ncbi:uncharacterized protein LOC126870432 isoform X1 [Bombus huntii]|uniref:uncharacterized protein LOC126870432 isoform X1 n=1 Tax=Bombus huntii TaxID=85661 RepID=UPI0021A9CB31|nr:uncharacterized protein LOC126870432 isoform X1 [Bombus huntii]XP_050484100.1 uncharacterized protein LOC126870432 isoform X1 [Bombus huntii]
MTSRCKCPKSDTKASEHSSPYLEDITMKIKERRCDLLGRQKYLKEKITTMERSIPALIAYNMWMSKNCDDAPYCKIRKIMKMFAPYPDQTEKLLESLKNTVKDLNNETEELHEKIIQADVKLEETEMELESLELINKEMNNKLKDLEKEVRCHTSPSLHSIHSEDLLCLTKIRQLAEEELNLKNCIKQLEKKETLFKEHMDRLLTSKEYQNVCTRKKVVSCIPDLNGSWKGMCYVPKKCLLHKQNESKKKQEGKAVIPQSDAIISTSKQNIEKLDQETEPEQPKGEIGKMSSWISNWWSNNEKSEVASQMRSANTHTSFVANNVLTEKLTTATVKPRIQSPTTQKKSNGEKTSDDEQIKLSKPNSKSAQCHRPCFTPQDLEYVLKKTCVGKHIPPCKIPCNKPIRSYATSSRKPFYELPRYTMADHGIRTGCKPYVLPCDLRNPCDIRDPCEICPSTPCPRLVGSCRCNCRGKCARGLSNAACNCSDDPLGPSGEYQPIDSKQLAEEDSEDEFCECCSCGCEDSDESLCQCT